MQSYETFIAGWVREILVGDKRDVISKVCLLGVPSFRSTTHRGYGGSPVVCEESGKF